jgi:hypothetical protein
MTGVRIYTDEEVTGLEASFVAPGLLQGENCHEF